MHCYVIWRRRKEENLDLVLKKKHLGCNCANVTHPIAAMISLVKILLKGIKMSHSTNMQMNA